MIANIIKNAKSAKGDFLESGFSKQLMKLGDEKMRALFTPKQIKQLNDFDKLSKLIAKSQQVARGSQTAALNKILNFLRGVAALGTLSTTALTEYGIVKFFNSKKGQKLLSGSSPESVQKLKDTLKKLNQPGLIEKTIK